MCLRIWQEPRRDSQHPIVAADVLGTEVTLQNIAFHRCSLYGRRFTDSWTWESPLFSPRFSWNDGDPISDLPAVNHHVLPSTPM